MKTKRVRKKPMKSCPKCQQKQHARVAACKCGHIFYRQKPKSPNSKKFRSREIKDWQSLSKGDIIKSVRRHGPFWMDPETHEKTYMGDYGRFAVYEVGNDYIVAYSTNKLSGVSILYMGKPKKSDLADNLYDYPHKLVSVS